MMMTDGILSVPDLVATKPAPKSHQNGGNTGAPKPMSMQPPANHEKRCLVMVYNQTYMVQIIGVLMDNHA